MITRLFTLLMLCSIASFAQLPAYVSSINLTAWYSFSSNSVDSSTNRYDGTVTGAALATDRFTNTVSAYHFNGSSDYISTPATFAINDSDKALSVWFKQDTIKRGWIVAGGYDLSGQAFGLFIQDTIGTLTFQGLGSYDRVLDTIKDTLWHHTVITYHADTLRAYVDNILKCSYNMVLSTSLSGMTIGRRQNPSLESGTDAYFEGLIDDIGMWRRAIDTCEIYYLYTASTHTCGSTSLYTKTLKKQAITVNPNPVKDLLNINNTDIQKVEVMSMVGQTLITERNSKQIDLSALTNGMYIIKVNDNFVTRIIKD